MSIKPLDSFITNSISLLEANPSQTLVSISYRNKDGQSLASFKAHNSHLGTTYKFRTSKSKDVSRLLSALGPRGVSITNGRIEKKKRHQKSKDVIGMSSLLVNTDVKEAVEEVASQPKSNSKKNKKKNKNKKR
ncbi:LAFE_0H15940g1_1 [Lachancea fermentati]|uniref:LAFE_0H15940g1_1 n=1 Tax=Lachancea fermentati TaxID=4955 RepID=A0A1G4MKY7_LACFM|nr:LAFE_0H15940g1_1 [Lachancea fermentati]